MKRADTVALGSLAFLSAKRCKREENKRLYSERLPGDININLDESRAHLSNVQLYDLSFALVSFGVPGWKKKIPL